MNPLDKLLMKIGVKGKCIDENLIYELTGFNRSSLKAFIKVKEIYVCVYMRGDKMYFTNEETRMILMLYDIQFVDFYLDIARNKESSEYSD